MIVNPADITNPEITQLAFNNFVLKTGLLFKIAPIHLVDSMVITNVKMDDSSSAGANANRGLGAPVNTMNTEISLPQITLEEYSISEAIDNRQRIAARTLEFQLLESKIFNCVNHIKDILLTDIDTLITTAGYYTGGTNEYDVTASSTAWTTVASANPRADIKELKSQWGSYSTISADDEFVTLFISRDLVNAIQTTDSYKDYIAKSYIMGEGKSNDEMRLINYLEVNNVTILEAYKRDGTAIFEEVCVLGIVESPNEGILIGNTYINRSSMLTAVYDLGNDKEFQVELQEGTLVTVNGTMIGGYTFSSPDGLTENAAAIVMAKSYVANAKCLARIINAI